jgi:transcriptional regulator with XRE-family HTH domain/Zn-dependent peptidase ImmA (M78 family)
MVIHSKNAKQALLTLGLTQKQLAEQLGVSAQAITNWLSGSDFPRPDKLLKLATTLGLNFSDLIVSSGEGEPVIAFRKKGGSKTTDEHISKAKAMGALLKPLLRFLPPLPSLRQQVQNPTCEYEPLQATVKEVRNQIGLGEQAVVEYHDLIGEFHANGSVLIPVLWGAKQNHKNALHILLPKEKVTFIYLNLDTRIEDFKFWMAHELAHVYTPQLAGNDVGEDFADAFAGALLFPKSVASVAYASALKQKDGSSELEKLASFAKLHQISVLSVFREVNRFAKEAGLALLRSTETEVNIRRNTQTGKLVSESLFTAKQPDAALYIASANNSFKSVFFDSLKKMIKSEGVGASYVHQVMDVPLQDAYGLHSELSR